MNVQEKIHAQVNANAVVLYMKGTSQFPQCGFSGATVQMLQACGLRDFAAVDVLADPEIWAGIKAYANWPTIPQLYVNGELVGAPTSCASCTSRVNCSRWSTQQGHHEIAITPARLSPGDLFPEA